MKIAFLVNDDLHSCMALNYLLPSFTKDSVMIIATSQVGKPGQGAPDLDLLRFAEHDFPFHYVAGANGETTAQAKMQTFPALCRRFQIPFHTIANINLRKHRNWLSQWAPDLLISIRHGRILKEKLLAIPRLGVLNLHSGLLPDYRGVMATFHALRAGENEIGTTLHTIDDGNIDTGNILVRTRFRVIPGRSYLWHVMAIYHQGCEEIVKAVDRLKSGQPLSTQPQSPGPYFTIPTREEMVDFFQKGWRLLAEEDLNHIAALFNPLQANASGESDSTPSES